MHAALFDAPPEPLSEALLEPPELPRQPIGVEQRVEAEPVDQPQEPLGDVRRPLVGRDLAGPLAVVHEHSEPVDQQRAPVGRTGHTSPRIARLQ